MVISTGYNGFARGVFDDPVKLEVTDEKLKWVCHAEANAIANAARLGVGLLHTHIYVNRFPRFGCCNLIIQSGIRRVYTLDNEYWKNDPGDPRGHSEEEVTNRRQAPSNRGPTSSGLCRTERAQSVLGANCIALSQQVLGARYDRCIYPWH